MLNFGKSNHDRIFKQRRLYLAIKVHTYEYLVANARL